VPGLQSLGVFVLMLWDFVLVGFSILLIRSGLAQQLWAPSGK
jgi:hypothetical protein